MLLFAVLVHASHATLKDRIIAFDGVGVNDSAHIFLGRMIDGLMHPEFLAKTLIGAVLVSHHECFFRDVSANYWHQLRIRNAFHVEAARFPAASYQSHCDIRAAWATLLLAFLF